MSFNAWGRAASDEVSWHNQPGKNKGLLESLTKCKKRNLAIYPVILTTSRLVTNAYLKGIMMDIKTVVTPLNISLSFSQPVSLVIPAEAQWFLIKTWYLRYLLPQSGVPNGKKNNAISSRISTRGQKKPFICISYMVGLNYAGSFLVAYSNYETIQRNVKRRLSQQMVRNDSLFVTIFHCFGPLFKLPK